MTEQFEDALLDGYRELSDAKQKFFIYDLRGWLANELLIRADKNADSARLNEVVRLLQLLDVGHARLATEVPR